MTTKLTLSIDVEKIKKIKRISKMKGRSVSKLIEDYIDDADRKTNTVKPDINKIVGAFGKPKKKFNADTARWEYLKKKYDL